VKENVKSCLGLKDGRGADASENQKKKKKYGVKEGPNWLIKKKPTSVLRTTKRSFHGKQNSWQKRWTLSRLVQIPLNVHCECLSVVSIGHG
jgi:hypothetical protein